MVLRSDETHPVAETPTESTGCFAFNSLATSAIAAVSAAPPALGVSRRAVSITFPDSSTTPPKTLVPPTSTPIV